MLRLNRDLRPRGALISQFVSTAVDGICCKQIVPLILTAPGIETRHCDRLLALLTEHEAKAIDPFWEGTRADYFVVGLVPVARKPDRAISPGGGPDDSPSHERHPRSSLRGMSGECSSRPGALPVATTKAANKKELRMADVERTYILTWNPSKWTWADYDQAVKQTSRGDPYLIPWSTGTTKGIREGDRLFLLRQNIDRGLIAVGHAASDCYQDCHWDGSGKVANFVRFGVDLLLPTEKHLPIEQLLQETAFTWNSMPASGMSLPTHDAEIVERLWKEHVETIQNAATGSKQRNPPWQRDELILALDLYFRHPPKTVSQTHPAVVALSELLNALPIHANRPDGDRFRNPNGVYMKLGNFLRFDPDYTGAGLSRGGKLEEEIWREFASNREELHSLAEAIAAGYSTVGNDVQLDDEEENQFPEGRVLYRLHRQRERNANLVSPRMNYLSNCEASKILVAGVCCRAHLKCKDMQPVSA